MISKHMEGPGFLAVAIQPGANTDDEQFHDWYNTEHGPLRLRLPFITSGDRYQAADGQRPQWSAVYHVTDLAWLERRIYTRMREERSKREKQVMSTFDSLDRKIYRLVSSREAASRRAKTPAPVTVAVSVRTREADVDDLNAWYEREHIDMLAKVPGWLRTRRFRLVVGGINGMPPEGEVEFLAVHDYDAENGIDGPEYKAAINTEWRNRVVPKSTWHERRIWGHHSTFDALEEAPSSVITTDGAELRFQLEGNPVDPVVVLVNSILTNFHIWDDVARSLMTGQVGGKTFRVLRYNSRGYSQQDKKSNDSRFDLLTDDLEYLLQRLNIEKAHAVVGVSMGGVTAINFAIRHGNLLDRFVACDCNVAAGAANSSAWAERVELARTKGMSALADVTVKRWFTPASHESSNAAKTFAMIEQANVDGFEQNTGALCNYDLRPHLESIRTPGLLIAGESDGKLPEAMQSFGIRSTRYVSIAGAGHLPMLENHDAFIEALSQFL